MLSNEKWRILPLTNKCNVGNEIAQIIGFLKEGYNLRIYNNLQAEVSSKFEKDLIAALMQFDSNHYKVEMDGPTINYEGLSFSKGWLLLDEHAFDGRVKNLVFDPYVKRIRHYLPECEIEVIT
jgi:hypothetical protein